MPQGFQIGPLTIRYYALIIIAGALLAAWLSSYLAKRSGKDPEMVWDMLPWLLIGGILGARLWHVFTPSASNAAMGLTTHYYLTHPLEILMIWKGGLGIPGGVIGGALALLIYCSAKKESFAEWADIIAPGLLIGQAVGRWGNFINQEVYGAPSELPWAITIDPPYRLPGFENVARYHPLFLYESLLNLLAAGILLLMHLKWKDKLYKGDIILSYLVLYPVIRFGLEFLRLDPSPVLGFNINQSVMGVVAIVASLMLVYRHFIHPPKQSIAPAAAESTELTAESAPEAEDAAETNAVEPAAEAPDGEAAQPEAAPQEAEAPVQEEAPTPPAGEEAGSEEPQA